MADYSHHFAEAPIDLSARGFQAPDCMFRTLSPLDPPRQVWDLKRNNSRVTMRGHRGSVTCVSFFDRDTCVAAGDERGKVVLHRVADAPSDDEVSPFVWRFCASCLNARYEYVCTRDR